MSLVHGIPVAWQTQPLFGPIHRDVMPEGLTIAEIIDRVPLPPQFEAGYGFVCVNGDPVPREWWSRVRPKVRRGEIQTVVTFHLSLQNPGGGGTGGGGGGKATIGIVASIAILAAATFVSAGALVPILGANFAQGTLGAALGAAAITIGGALLVAALAPPPSSAQSAANTTTEKEKAASLSGNLLQAGAPLPRILGTKRIKPPLVCPVLVDLNAETEIAEAVFGLAGPHQLTDVRIGNVPVSQMPEVQFELQEGWPGSPSQTLVPRYSKTATPQVTLSEYVMNPTSGSNAVLDQSNYTADLPYYQQVTTRQAPDEAWLHLIWDKGFSLSSSPTTVITTPVRVQIRQRGTANWRNLPEIHFSSATANAYQKIIKLIWQSAPSTLPVPFTVNSVIRAFKHTPFQTISPSGAAFGGWDADSYFSAGAGNDLLDATHTGTNATTNRQGGGQQGATNVLGVALTQDGAIFYLDPASWPQDFYDIRIIRGQTFTESNFVATTFTYTPRALVVDFFNIWQDVGPIYRTQEVQANFNDEILLARVVSVWNSNPVTPGAGIATISMKIQHRSANVISVLTSGYTPVLTSSGDWTSTYGTSSNPADHYHDVLVGTLGSFQVPLSSVDIAGLTSWRNWCATKGYNINAVVEGQKEIDVLNLIAAAGFARPRLSELLGVVLDKDRTTDPVVQVFTPRNLQSFRWEKAFGNLPDGLRARFDNITVDYEEDQLIVIDPLAGTKGSRLEDIRYEVHVTDKEVLARARFDLLQARKRLTFYFGEADAENIVCTRGDLVAVQHDIITPQAGFAYVQSVITSGGNITGLLLDDTVTTADEDFFTGGGFFVRPTAFFNKPPRLGCTIRQLDGTIVTREVTRDSTDTDSPAVFFVTPFTNPGSTVIGPGAMVTTGLLGSEYQRLIVFNVMPKDDLTATISFVDEAPSIWPVPVTLAGLVSHYTMDDTTGADTTGAHNTNAVLGTPTLVTGKYKGGVQFDGAAAGYRFDTSFVTVGSDRTVMCWFQTTQSGILFAQTDTVTNPSLAASFVPTLYVGPNTGFLVGGYYDGSTRTFATSFAVNDGRIHHAAFSVSAAGAAKLYCDGVLITTGSFGAPSEAWWTRSWIGVGEGGINWFDLFLGTIWFNGMGDDYQIYNRVLSDAEVATIFSGWQQGV